MSVPSEKVLEELFKFRLAQLKADSEYATQAVSLTVRTAALGLTALVFPFITTEDGKLSALMRNHSSIIAFAASMGIIAIILDILQNVISDALSRSELDRLARNLKVSQLSVNSPADFMLSENSSWALARSVFYYLKTIAVAIGVLALMLVIGSVLPASV